MNTLSTKIAKASQEVGALATDKKNPQGNYDYISADKILQRAGDALANNGLSLVPSITNAVTESYRTNEQSKPYWCANVAMVMTLSDGDTTLEYPWHGMGTDYTVADKAFFKAITSGHKYFLMKLLNIGVGNEDGEHENPPPAEQARNGGAQQQTRPTAAATNGTTTGNGTANGAAAKGAAKGNGGQFEPRAVVEQAITAAVNATHGALWQAWEAPAQAKTWAVECGACKNEHEASNSFAKLVKEQFGGTLNVHNIKDVYAAFYAHQMDKLSKQAEAAVKSAPEMVPA